MRAFLLLLLAPLAFTQSFDVASVKRSQTQGKARLDHSPGRLSLDANLRDILKFAYDVRSYQISGPPLLTAERYVIAAKAEGPTPLPELKVMLQALLKDQFQLQFHRETKELAVYALIVAKGGPKLTLSSADGEPVTENAKRLGSGGTSRNTTMAQFADLLDGSCPDPVVDQTGLKGHYDFTLDFSSYLNGIQPGDLPSLLDEALQKQLGLSLKPRKIPIEVLIIDHVVGQLLVPPAGL